MPGSAEGVFAGRFEDGARCGACGRGRTQAARLGGAGAPPGGTRTPCEELADGDEPERLVPESAARRRTGAAMERREAPRIGNDA